MEWRFSLSDASDYHFELDAKCIEQEAKRLGLRLGKAGSQITFRPQDVNFYDESENVVANLLEMVLIVTLARVRKLSRNTPALQFNIATHGG